MNKVFSASLGISAVTVLRHNLGCHPAQMRIEVDSEADMTGWIIDASTDMDGNADKNTAIMVTNLGGIIPGRIKMERVR